jgi:hypothetical protein
MGAHLLKVILRNLEGASLKANLLGLGMPVILFSVWSTCYFAFSFSFLLFCFQLIVPVILQRPKLIMTFFWNAPFTFQLEFA